MKHGRNDPCPCGSGKKYKKCCGPEEAANSSIDRGAINIQSTLQQAVQFHQQGRLVEAEALYLKVLEKDPNQADSLNLLGIIALSRGNHSTAEELIRKAIRQDDRAAFFYLNLGNALKPQGKADEAIDNYRHAIMLEPNLAEAHYNLANEFQLKGDYEDAINSYHQAIRINPQLAEAYYNLANALKHLERFDEAIEKIDKALLLNPEYAEAHYLQGVIFEKLKQPDKAEEHFREVLRIAPGHIEACFDLADILRKQERSEEAEYYFRLAIDLSPDFADAFNNLAITLRQQGRIDEAIEAYLRALNIEPSATTYTNLAAVLQEDGQVDKAIECCEHALAMDPSFADAHWNLAMAILFNGDFSRGWKEYDWRFLKVDPVFRPFQIPTWDGSSLKDKTILIYSEQGIGDHIMFASMFNEIIEQSGRCIIECDFRLVDLFKRSFAEAIVMPIAGDPESFREYNGMKIDFKVAMGSLPFFLRRNFSNAPQKSSYVIADHKKTGELKQRLTELNAGIKVGISWRGGKERSVRTMRSTSLEQWKALFSIPGVQFINLQYGAGPQELQEIKETLGLNIHNFNDIDPLKDLDAFASLIAALDLVISVDNSTVHLAGALGVPTWVLLPKGCDWRWMKDYEDTPWYKSVRLFRQHNHGEWQIVFDRIEKVLRHCAEEGRVSELLPQQSYKDLAASSYRNSKTYLRRSDTGKKYKCALITPVGPGHRELYGNCLDSINRAFANHNGRFSEIIPIMIDDTEGKLGRSKARNTAIRKASDIGAEWIFFLDADDEMSPLAFNYVSLYLDEYDAIWGNIWSFEGKGEAKERARQLPFLFEMSDVLSCDPFVTLQMGHFIKTSAAVSNLFNEELDTGEDFDYYLRIWDRYACIKIPMPFFYNRRGQHSEGPKSATGGRWRQNVERIIAEYRKNKLRF